MRSVSGGIKSIYSSIYFFTTEGLLKLPGDKVIDIKNIGLPYVYAKKSEADVLGQLRNTVDTLYEFYEKDFVDFLKQHYQSLEENNVHLGCDLLEKRVVGKGLERYVDGKLAKSVGGKVKDNFFFKGYVALSDLRLKPVIQRLPSRNPDSSKFYLLDDDYDLERLEKSARIKLPVQAVVDTEEFERMRDGNSILQYKALNDKKVVVNLIREFEAHLFFNKFHPAYGSMCIPHESYHLNQVLYLNWKAEKIAEKENKSLDEVLLKIINNSPADNEKSVLKRITSIYSGLDAFSMIPKISQELSSDELDETVRFLLKYHRPAELLNLLEGSEISANYFAVYENRDEEWFKKLLGNIDKFYRDVKLDLPDDKYKKIITENISKSEIKQVVKEYRIETDFNRNLKKTRRTVQAIRIGAFGVAMMSQFLLFNPLLAIGLYYSSRPLAKAFYSAFEKLKNL